MDRQAGRQAGRQADRQTDDTCSILYPLPLLIHPNAHHISPIMSLLLVPYSDGVLP